MLENVNVEHVRWRSCPKKIKYRKNTIEKRTYDETFKNALYETYVFKFRRTNTFWRAKCRFKIPCRSDEFAVVKTNRILAG